MTTASHRIEQGLWLKDDRESHQVTSHPQPSTCVASGTDIGLPTDGFRDLEAIKPPAYEPLWVNRVSLI